MQFWSVYDKNLDLNLHLNNKIISSKMAASYTNQIHTGLLPKMFCRLQST